MTIGVVVDVDDTLVNTDTRRWMVWNNVLNRVIPLEDVASLGSRQILERYGLGDNEVWKRFWRLLLCWEKNGTNILKLDKPVPFASQVLQKWSDQYKVVYLTGRSTNMRDLTLDELDRFGFPTADVDLVMLKPEDWTKYFTSKTTQVKLRTRLFASVSKQCTIDKVVDDYPPYFTVYRQFNISDRIGLLRSKRFSSKDYLGQGATKVTTWKQIWNNL